MHRAGRTTSNTYCDYLETQVDVHRFNCSSIKHCEYLVPELRDLHHSKMTEDLQKKMTSHRIAVENEDPDPMISEANS